MTTYLPYRANVFCSLGHLIDGQFADTYLQQAGLIFCRGSIRLAGIFRPDIGTVVDFAYTRDNVTAARIPRRLRVLSSFADPFTKVTTVQIGCKLSLLQENREPEAKVVTSVALNPTLPTLWQDYFAAPITANSVAQECLTRLGITAAAALPLTNRFTADFIDLSNGYVEVLGKLLESETYVGWLDENEELEIRSLLNSGGATGPVINNTNCFTLSPIGVGSLPGESVTVTYSALRFSGAGVPVDGDGEIIENQFLRLPRRSGWSGGITYGAPVPYEIRYGSDQVFRGSYIPVQDTSAEFLDGLMVRSSTASFKPYAAVAGKFASQALTAGLTVPLTQVLSRSETVNRYNKNGQLAESVLTETESLIEFAGGLDLTFVFSPTDYVIIPDGGEVVKQRAITRNTYNGNAVRREVQRYQNWSSTLNGQQAVNEGRQTFGSSGNVAEFINGIIESLAYIGTEVSIADSSAEQPQRLPGPAALTEAADGDGRPRTAETLTEYVFGSSNAERNVNFQMPYAGDDYYGLVGSTWVPLPGSLQAKTKAINYGRVQNRIRLGNAQGVSLQIPVELLPTSPFDALYLQADGLTGQYRANGMSWTFNQDGIVGQVDALFWLAIGQTGTPGDIWFPMPPAVTTLPTTPTATVNGSPAPANSASLPGGWNPAAPDLTTLFNTTLPTGVAPVYPSELNVTAGLEPFTETVTIDAVTRSVLVVEELPFSLEPLEEDVDIITTAVFDVSEVVIVLVPLTMLTLTAFAPAVYAPVVVSVPLTTLTLTAFAPVIYTPVTVNVPLTALTLTAFAPTLNLLSVPLTTLTLTSYTPTVTGNATDPDFANVSLLLSMEGTNGSTTFTDLSSNAFAISVFGDAQVVTTDGDFTAGALDLDGTGDYLTTPANAAFQLGTGDFTVECYCKPDVINGNDGLFTFGDNDSGLALALVSSSWALTSTGGSATLMGSATANARQHVAVTRSGTSLRLFVGGTQVGSTQTNSTDFTDNQLKIGYYFSTSFPFDGRISWFRVTKGVARYTGTFTPPSTPFPTA